MIQACGLPHKVAWFIAPAVMSHTIAPLKDTRFGAAWAMGAAYWKLFGGDSAPIDNFHQSLKLLTRSADQTSLTMKSEK